MDAHGSPTRRMRNYLRALEGLLGLWALFLAAVIPFDEEHTPSAGGRAAFSILMVALAAAILYGAFQSEHTDHGTQRHKVALGVLVVATLALGFLSWWSIGAPLVAILLLIEVRREHPRTPAAHA